MSHFTIRCRKCGKELTNVYCAFCEHCKDSLLVTIYNDTLLKDDLDQGIWRFNWLPVHGSAFPQSGTVVYQSRGLGQKLGLSNLYIAFNGYWPEMGGLIKTCTFKEFEAAVVIQNAIENKVEGLVVASAGNTARAFAHLSTVSGFPVIIVVPNMCLQEMWYLEDSSRVPTVAVADGDYSDSIDVARRMAQIFNYPFEGGVKNIAKRDGLGISILEAVSTIGRIPDHYFQAVGSGTGAIGVWEMSERLLHDGRFGTALPRLHLAQNLPFAPMVKAWNRKSRQLFPEDLRPELIGEITTRVLSTRYPAYSLLGGVYDAMTACGGHMYGVVNDEVYASMDLFEETEGIDIVPAAGVATAALRQAVSKGTIGQDDLVLLNITGGGEKRLGQERKPCNVVPVVVSKKYTDKEIEEALCSILKPI